MNKETLQFSASVTQLLFSSRMNSSKNSCPLFQYKSLLIFNNLFSLTFTLAAVYLSVILFQLIYKKFGLYHVNVRTLLLHFCIANGVTSICIMTRMVYNFFLVLFGLDHMQMRRLQCFGFDSVYGICNTVSSLSISAIGFERLMATINQRNTDPDKSNNAFNLVAGSIWLGAILEVFISFWYIIATYEDSTMCYCFAAGTVSNYYLIVVLALCTISQITTFLCFGYVVIINKKVAKDLTNISKYTLQERYQISNNISTTISLLPNVISNSVLYTAACFAYFFVWPPFWNGQVEFVIHLLSGINDLISITCFLQPALLLKFNKNLNKMALEEYKSFQILNRWLPTYSNCKNTAKVGDNLNVVSFRVSPDKNKEILESMWIKYPSRKQ